MRTEPVGDHGSDSMMQSRRFAAPLGNLALPLDITSSMKMAKAIRRQADTAERVAATTADARVADEMRSLAQAFRSQADILKKKQKKKKEK